MANSVKIKVGKSGNTVEINIPEVCGACQGKADHNLMSWTFVNGDTLNLEAVFKCSRCNSFFIGYYQRNNKYESFYLVHVSPAKPKEKNFSTEILGVSPRFVKYYNQLLQAEQLGLDFILDSGYRKALETLIKDYLLYTDPIYKQMILNMTLEDCIQQLNNDRIHEISKKAGILGKTEIQNSIQWSGKELNDLKKMIDVTSSFITVNIKLKKQLDQMGL